ncbi:MAG: acetolactate synthase small subunit [Spirochaetes bacterium]|nr:acetolactate synthase small subunit [Spirochaetota bacterium]
MRYLLSLIVENKHGVLAKISQVITGRGYNISTLSVGPSHDEDTSRMVLAFDCEEKIIQQVVKQLNKLIDVIKVFLIDENNSIERELVLIKIARKKETEESLFRLTQIFNAKIINVNHKTFSIELTAQPKIINNFIDNIRAFGIQDLLRTGPLAI